MAMTKSQRRRVTTVVRYTVLTIWALIAFFPIYWMVSTSFKPDNQWFSWPPYYFPEPPTLANYSTSGSAPSNTRRRNTRSRRRSH